MAEEMVERESGEREFRRGWSQAVASEEGGEEGEGGGPGSESRAKGVGEEREGGGQGGKVRTGVGSTEEGVQREEGGRGKVGESMGEGVGKRRGMEGLREVLRREHDHPTMLVMVEWLLTMRLLALLWKLLREQLLLELCRVAPLELLRDLLLKGYPGGGEGEEGSCGGSMPEPPKDVRAREKRGKERRGERRGERGGRGRGEGGLGSAPGSGEKGREAPGVAVEEGGRGGEPGDTGGSYPREKSQPNPEDLPKGPKLVVDEVVAHVGGGLDEVSEPMGTTVSRDEGSSEDSASAARGEIGAGIGESVDEREFGGRWLRVGGEDSACARGVERDGEVKEVHPRANMSNARYILSVEDGELNDQDRVK
ncbi:hypothetical protein CYMTET_18501 [Cymbomonas tetramitiformis]|uniref:Uncharacterized protein n=1 Tax=Cymbomonas tetramitiformis TaxID=36881 RepID=A0AAE0G8E8_9CHLO|nr:hypothetical protein CYMTET_18501 [Cymbomonas tetramitiformis]